jgi:hypothetical protein
VNFPIENGDFPILPALPDGFQTHLDEPNGAAFDGVACTTPMDPGQP